MERIGLIDMGSNTVRLVVYEVERDKDASGKKSGKAKGARSEKSSGTKGAKAAKTGTKTRDVVDAEDDVITDVATEKLVAVNATEVKSSTIPPFKAVFDTKATLGLAAAIKEGQLEDEAMDAAIEALIRHRESARLLGATQIKVFATAFVRELKNGSEVRGRLEEAVGLPITTLSGDEEAHLGFVGASSAIPIDSGTVVDLGGGSCELTAVRGGKDVSRISVGMGCVTAFAHFVRVVLPTPSEVARIQAGFEEKLGQFDLELFKTKKIVGLGGSARFSGALLGQIWDTPIPKTFTEDDLDRLLAIQEGDPHRFSHQLVLCDASRMHSAVPGIAILQKLMQVLGAETLHLSHRGVREGFLIERVLS